MSLPNQVVMPADGAPNPATIPGTTRIYLCGAGASITVNGDDARVLRNMGWMIGGAGNPVSAGTTAQRPTSGLYVGYAYLDTTLEALVQYGGPKAGWLHHATGAAS